MKSGHRKHFCSNDFVDCVNSFCYLGNVLNDSASANTKTYDESFEFIELKFSKTFYKCTLHKKVYLSLEC